MLYLNKLYKKFSKPVSSPCYYCNSNDENKCENCKIRFNCNSHIKTKIDIDDLHGEKTINYLQCGHTIYHDRENAWVNYLECKPKLFLILQATFIDIKICLYEYVSIILNIYDMFFNDKIYYSKLKNTILGIIENYNDKNILSMSHKIKNLIDDSNLLEYNLLNNINSVIVECKVSNALINNITELIKAKNKEQHIVKSYLITLKSVQIFLLEYKKKECYQLIKENIIKFHNLEKQSIKLKMTLLDPCKEENHNSIKLQNKKVKDNIEKTNNAFIYLLGRINTLPLYIDL